MDRDAPSGPNNLDAYWMPFTANRVFKDNPRFLVTAKDMHYATAEGRPVLDADGRPRLIRSASGALQPASTSPQRQARRDARGPA